MQMLETVFIHTFNFQYVCVSILPSVWMFCWYTIHAAFPLIF